MNNKIVGRIRLYNLLLNAALLLCLSLYLLSFFKIGSLPNPSQIDPLLLESPQQIDRKLDDFSFSYRGEEYLVNPQAVYELSGLVVSHNDIQAFYDIYHDADSVDLKDLCVIWGDNLKTSAYQKVKYYSESVSCHFQAGDQETYQNFNPSMLSNNHLISDDETVRNKIRSVRVGDQIRLSGMLVNYSPASYPDWVRKSSLTRKDAAGGACEVVFVRDSEILKRYPRNWFDIYDKSKDILFYLIILKIISFLVLPWVEYKFE